MNIPEEKKKIDLKGLEEIIALIVTKKEEPTYSHLSLFGWDGRYELEGKKGALFEQSKVPMLNAIGMKQKYYNVDHVFIDFDQLLSLYPYSECLLNVLEAYRHSTDVQILTTQIKDLQEALSLAKQQIKDLQEALSLAKQQINEIEQNTFNKVLACIKK